MNILNIADEIEKERKRQGLTVEALCANAGVERSTYYRWLSRKALPKTGPLSCVMDVLNLEISITKRGHGNV